MESQAASEQLLHRWAQRPCPEPRPTWPPASPTLPATVTRSGDLEMFGLALEKVPHSWREDPRWRTPHGGGNRDLPAHRAKFPSRCVGGARVPGGWGWGWGCCGAG